MGKIGEGQIVRIGDSNYPCWEWGCRQGGWLNKQVMYANLLDFKHIMEKFNIKFFPIFGSLLGMIREKDCIAYDSDADFACLENDYYKMYDVVSELTKLGFFIPDRNCSPLHDHHIIREGEKIEIWWFIKVDNLWIYDNRVRYPEKYFNQPNEINFLGETWKVPNNPKEFLTLTYGETWITPNKAGAYILDYRKK